MIIQPKIRGFICTTAHPVGCAQAVQEQIDYVKSKPPLKNGPKKVLVIGASTGYGLSSRIVPAFSSRASTIGVFFEKEAEDKRTATAGWYNSVAFEKAAIKEGLYAKSFNGDAFSQEIKQRVGKIIKKDWGSVDLVIYSLASPRRIHPLSGEVAKSVLKPIGASYTNHSIDMSTDQLETVTLPQATEEEVNQTVSVMGGEDWQFWIEALEKEKLLAQGVRTVAYSYIGPELTRPVYRNGTIGKAKDHLEVTAKQLNERFKKYNGRALISVNKALVTQSSSAIPFIPLYFIILNKVMKEKGIEEDCISQIHRLFAARLYSGSEIVVDSEGRIRMDDFETREDIQKEVERRWQQINNQNLNKFSDLEGYHQDFLRLFGFGIKGVDYTADVEANISIPSISL